MLSATYHVMGMPRIQHDMALLSINGSISGKFWPVDLLHPNEESYPI